MKIDKILDLAEEFSGEFQTLCVKYLALVPDTPKGNPERPTDRETLRAMMSDCTSLYHPGISDERIMQQELKNISEGRPKK